MLTRAKLVPNPMKLAIAQNKTVGLTPNCILVRRDGVESSIEDSAAPIHDRRGTVTGAVMVFHDVTTARALSLRMAYLAQHDGLTDLPNRTLLDDRLKQAIALASRRKRQAGIAVPGHGSFQAHQRFPGPRDRRPPAAIRRASTAWRACAAATRSAGKAGMNSSFCSGHFASRGCSHQRRKNTGRRLLHPIRSTSTICTLPEASVSPLIRTTAWTPTHCCSMRTSRCTTPRRTGATTFNSSSRR